jgi:dienelactone hydrolase
MSVGEDIPADIRDSADGVLEHAPGVPTPAMSNRPPGGQQQHVTIRTKKGDLRAVVAVPDVIAPAVVPVIVVAPGKGYHMELPLIRGLFERCTAEGWAAVRFDWGFHTAKRDPSANFAQEVEDLQAVLSYARSLPGVDRSRIYIAGKSLGAGVALERAAADPSIRGVILMTPPIHSPKPEYKMGTVRPRLEKLRQPSLIVVGEHDPLCELGRLYTLIAGLAHPPHVAVVGGDHSLRAAYGSESAANVDLALAHAVDWLKRQALR